MSVVLSKKLNRIGSAAELVMPGQVLRVFASKANAAIVWPIARDTGEPGKSITIPANATWTSPVEQVRAVDWRLQSSGDADVSWAVMQPNDTMGTDDVRIF